MESLLFATNATLPIVIMVLVGYFIKRIGLLKSDAAKVINNIVFRVLLPAMLFLNIYNIEDLGSISLNYVWYVLGFTILLFLIFLPIVNVIFEQKNQRGVILQSIFRSNYALIGIPLATALFGSEGAAIASLLAAFIVPVFNILGVICLCIYSEDDKPDFKKILINIAKNPLICGVAAGLVALGVRAIFVNVGIEFRLTQVVPVFSVLTYLSSAATPMALLALGAQLLLVHGHQIHAMEENLAAIRPLQQIDAAHQRGFTGAGQADDSENLALFHRDIHMLQSFNLITAVTEGLRQIFHLDNRFQSHSSYVSPRNANNFTAASKKKTSLC